MDRLEQLNDFDFMNFSDLDNYLKPTNPTIKKDFVDSLTNLSNLISNGILYINYNIYENLSNQSKNSNDKSSQYVLPKECKKLSKVISKGIKKDKLRNYENKGKSHNDKPITQKQGIGIIITDTDKNKDNRIDEDYFGMDQSIIKSRKDFTFDGMDSSMLFDQSALFSNLDLSGDHGNQSMIIVDTNEKDLFSNDDPTNRSSMFININGLTDPEGNNSTLVSLTDVDNNYLSTSDIESSNSTAYWDDYTSNGRNSGSEGSSPDEDDQQLVDEFDQSFSKKKLTGLDSSRDVRKLGYRKQKLIRHTHPSSTIQVNQLQIYQDTWNDYDDIKFVKSNMKKQNIKNSFPHNILYPVVGTPPRPDDVIDSSEFYPPSRKGAVNNYRNDNDEINNNNSSFIKDDLSITKDIVNKNIKIFNSLGMENDESFQKIDPSSSNFSFSNISFISNNDNNGYNQSFASSNINRLNTPSPQPSASSNSSNDNNIISSVDNFEYLQSKFDQPNQNDEDIQLTKTNHVWKYKTNQDLVESSIIKPEEESNQHEKEEQSSVVIPENVNIKDRINNIEASLLTIDDGLNKDKNECYSQHSLSGSSTTDVNDSASLEEDISSNIAANKNDSSDPSVVDSTIIEENENDFVIKESIGAVKDLVTGLEKAISVNDENDNIHLSSTTIDHNTSLEEGTTSSNAIDNQNDSSDSSMVSSTIIEENENDLVIKDSIGTVKDLVTGLEKVISIDDENVNVHLSNNDSINNELELNETLFSKENKEKEEEDSEEEEEEEEEPIEYISDYDNEKEEKEELMEFISDNDENENEEQPIDYIQDHTIDESILFEKDAHSLINDNIINGNLEDDIIIEEEDSIIGNAIEEALENKSLVIQENEFMDEPFTNDVSYTYDDHATFHEPIIFFNGSAPLETIPEEDEEDLEEEEGEYKNQEFTINQIVDNKFNEDIYNDPIHKETINEEKIFEMIECNISKPEISIHDPVTCSENDVKTKLPLVDEQVMNLIPIDNTYNNNNNNNNINNNNNDNKVIIPEFKTETVVSQDNKSEKFLDENKNNSKKVIKTKVVKKIPVKSNKVSNENKKSLEKSIKKTKPVTSLVLPTKNHIPTLKKQNPLISGNCVKAFTSTSLKQNIINTRPIEHEVTLSFSDFDNNIKSKPKPKPLLKSKSITRTKPNPKSIPKKPTVSGSNIKPLTKSKINKIKTTKTISKTSSNKAIISKTNKKLIKKKVTADPKIFNQKKNNTIRRRTINRSYLNSNIFNSENHVTYFPKTKRKNFTEYTSDIQSKENTYYQWIKDLLPEYIHKFNKYELSDVMSKSFVFEAIIMKLSPEYKSKDYNPKRNIFKPLLPLDNIKKFNEVLSYIQKRMKITVVITAYDLHFGNLSSIFIIIRQLQRYENNHLNNK